MDKITRKLIIIFKDGQELKKNIKELKEAKKFTGVYKKADIKSSTWYDHKGKESIIVKPKKLKTK